MIDNYKKVIAREWLILIVFSIIGCIYTITIPFHQISNYIEIRKSLYRDLRSKYLPSSKFDPSTAKRYYPNLPPLPPLNDNRIKLPYFSRSNDVFDSFEPDIDTSVHLGTFEEFSDNLDSKTKRKELFDSFSRKFNLGDYESFENKITSPSIFSGFSKFVNHLFSRWYWFETWASVLSFYLIFQFIRTIVFSIKTLRK